jgi:hypothetical protein
VRLRRGQVGWFTLVEWTVIPVMTLALGLVLAAAALGVGL